MTAWAPIEPANIDTPISVSTIANVAASAPAGADRCSSIRLDSTIRALQNPTSASSASAATRPPKVASAMIANATVAAPQTISGASRARRTRRVAAKELIRAPAPTADDNWPGPESLIPRSSLAYTTNARSSAPTRTYDAQIAPSTPNALGNRRTSRTVLRIVARMPSEGSPRSMVDWLRRERRRA